MLYDLEHDPEEQHNLAPVQAARAVQLQLSESLASRLKELRYGQRVSPGAA
jgi:hypothetical protein